MKKALWVVGILVSLWALLWAGSRLTERSYAKQEWPAGLGPVADVPGRFPEAKLNASAAELMRLSAAIGVDIGPRHQKDRPKVDEAILDSIRKDLGEWNGVQLAKTAGGIDATPPALAAYLTKVQPQLDATRDHLLRSDPPQWPSNLTRGFAAPIPNLLGHMTLTRLFVARSLEKSRANDIAAWDELHAAWNLNRGLWKKPMLIETLIALATTRMMNAAAGKAPLDEPGWYAEVRAVDLQKAMISSNQAEAWMMTKASEDALYSNQEEKPNPIVRGFVLALSGPYLRVSGSNAAEHMRLMTTEAAAVTQCNPDVAAFDKKHLDAIPRWNILGRIAVPNLGGAWQRVRRYQVELEATERYQQLKRGETPTLTSRCSDGAWQVTTGPDGTKTVRFSPDIPVPPPGTKYPLEYSVAAVAETAK